MFEDVLNQAVALLQRQGRVAYATLKRQFGLGDAYVADLKEAILYAYPQVVDDGHGLRWPAEIESPCAPSPAAPDHTVHIPVAERRQLTVMFCDLANSMRLSNQLDPEDYRDVIRFYQERCATVIVRFEGYIARYMGDGLLVYFGYPRAQEDAAQRAVQTGLEIVSGLPALNAELHARIAVLEQHPLQVRIGIHTGAVVIESIGAGLSREHQALGETPNIAARLQDVAPPNTVVVSEDTYRLITGYFTWKPLGDQALKGVENSVVVYRAMAESGVQSRLDVVMLSGLTPLVGREREVGLLEACWRQARESHGQVILLSGEAGIGKSRLVQVLKDHVADEPHTRLECHSSPYYQNTVLYPVIDLLHHTLQWQPDDTPETKLEKLEQVLQPYRLPLNESVPIFASLLSLRLPEARYAALDLTPQQQRQKTYDLLAPVYN